MTHEAPDLHVLIRPSWMTETSLANSNACILFGEAEQRCVEGTSGSDLEKCAQQTINNNLSKKPRKKSVLCHEHMR